MGTTSANMAGFNDVPGKDWQSQYDNEVQAVQSRVQHHWHFRDEKGNEVPMPYCKLKKTSKKTGCQCKMGFPRKVLPKVRPRVVCPGNAASLGLQCSGRRNALGSIAGRDDARTSVQHRAFFQNCTSPTLTCSFLIACHYCIPRMTQSVPQRSACQKK